MPKKSNKSKVIDEIFWDAVIRMEDIDTSDDSEEDRNHEELVDDIEQALACRIGFSTKVPKQKAWLNEVLPEYDDSRFKQATRVSRRNFQNILSLIQDHSIFNTSKSQFSVSVQLAVSLYRLGTCGTGASISAVARLFGLGDGSTVVRFTRRIIQVLCESKDKYIYWPDKKERKEITDNQYKILPKCIGYVDGVHIPFEEAPTLDKDSYYDKNKRYSLQVQLICDPSKRIRHFVAGYPGSVHDSRVWNECQIALHPDKYFNDEQWICGDKGYGLGKHIITPFRENSKVAEKIRRSFNKYMASQRVKIEHVNGILKEVFGSLKELRIRVSGAAAHKEAVDWISACRILYNIIMPEDTILENTENIEDSPDDTNNDHAIDDSTAEDKRMALYYFIQNDL